MPSGCDIFRIPLLIWLIAQCDEFYVGIGNGVYISAWASKLFVQLYRLANASTCGTSNKKSPRSPFIITSLPWAISEPRREKSMKTKSFFSILAMGFLAASCSSESTSLEPSTSGNENQIQFATNAKPIITTKAVNDASKLQDRKFVVGAPINIYLTNHETNAGLVPHVIGGQAIAASDYYKFTASATPYTGTGSTADSQVLTAPNNYVFQYPGTDGVDVYALHPATTGVNVDKATISFSVQEDQTADADYTNSDLISATAVNKTKADGTILLTFKHHLSKVVVKLQTDANENLGLVLEGAKISINGMSTVALTHTNASTSATELTLGAASAPKNIVLGEYDADNGTAGIIIPQTAQKDQKLITVTLANGASFSYTPTDDELFEPEKVYEYTLTLKAELLTLVSVEIKDWTTVQRTGDAVLD